ncbi:MAG: hypothetical protein ABIJ42_06720 [Acidobacteriota bacterium]
MNTFLAHSNGKDINEFLEKFILFHLGRDAEIEINASPDGSVSCSLIHSRIQEISFEMKPAQVKRFSEDIPAFEDYLLELLTRNRRGGEIDD